MDTIAQVSCYHCGDDCASIRITKDEKSFCCNGCLQVYGILSSSELGNYYQLNSHPGKNQKKEQSKFAFLSEPEIIAKLISYQDDKKTIVSFYVPSIHCSSCIWLLERLNTLHHGILENRVDFLKKQVTIQFKSKQITLKELVELMESIGYSPLISFQDVLKKNQQKRDPLLPKIAVAGFCFGNAMMLSFPSYFGLGETEKTMGNFFSLLSLIFTFPAVFYSGNDYFKQAYHNIKNGVLNIDFPLALGITVLFVRTLAAYIFKLGDGFADSLTGLIFFLLVGRYIQQKTYHHLSFERDYRSFFPVAVQVLDEKQQEKSVPLEKLKKGDRILVKNQEIIPADAILLKGEAMVDFSFVTGEAQPEQKTLGEIIYAGGRQTLSAIELEVIKPVSQSYLTALWNNEAFNKAKPNQFKTFVNKVSRHFSIGLLMLSLGTLLFWLPQDWEKGLNAFTAILIVACPCALALSTPFTMAAALSIFDKNKFYLKNTDVVEQLAEIDTMVFDKTGTVTLSNQSVITFSGVLSDVNKAVIYAVCKNSNHPLSRRICSYLGSQPEINIIEYFEIPGAGINAIYKKELIAIGSRFFVINQNNTSGKNAEVHVQIGERYLGFFIIKQSYRAGLEDLISDINKNYTSFLLSGDTADEATFLRTLFKEDHLYFKQSPQDKLNFIAERQKQNAKVLMIGDGLNDAGALKQSNAGIAVTEDINNFTPGSDAILDAKSIGLLPLFMRFSKSAVKVVHFSFLISLCYNLVGISFAMRGNLSPLIAAILMPVSTITIISFTSLAVNFAARKYQLLT
jgi:Cu+-exporting ATPase